MVLLMEYSNKLKAVSLSTYLIPNIPVLRKLAIRTQNNYNFCFLIV